MTVVAIALGLGAPAYSEWIQNTQIRTAAESMLSGIQLARAEALNRNQTVRFQLMTSIDSGCALSTAGANWVVSVDEASGLCDQLDPSATPFVVRRKSSAEGSKNASYVATASNISFNGLGQTGVAAVTIDVQNAIGGTCVAKGGPMRCLQLQISTAGEIRMCDPVVASDDPRACRS